MWYSVKKRKPPKFTREIKGHPPTPHQAGPMLHSDSVGFYHKKYGKMVGTFFPESGGFYRDEKTGRDYSAKNIIKWKLNKS